MAEFKFNQNSHIKCLRESFGQESTTFLSLTWLPKAMSAPSKITPGLYRIELITIQAKGTQSAPTPKFYLTSNGEGNQLTLEEPTGHSSQEVINITKYNKCVSCTYPLTCFCVVVENPATIGRRQWLAMPYNCTMGLQGWYSCFPGCRWTPWPSFSHQEPASMAI